MRSFIRCDRNAEIQYEGGEKGLLSSDTSIHSQTGPSDPASIIARIENRRASNVSWLPESSERNGF